MLASWRLMTKIEGSRSISQRHGSADPDPHQNVMDPQHWRQECKRRFNIWLKHTCVTRRDMKEGGEDRAAYRRAPGEGDKESGIALFSEIPSLFREPCPFRKPCPFISKIVHFFWKPCFFRKPCSFFGNPVLFSETLSFFPETLFFFFGVRSSF